MKRTIFPYDFAPYYPVGILPCPMYVDVANRVYDRIRNLTLELPDADDLKKEIAINVAIYFEDKMSGIGLWNAFVSKHLLEYFRALPFHDDFDKLDKKDVNDKEVELLVWLVLSRNFGDFFLNPLATGESTAKAIMEVLSEDDEVEVNEALYDYIYDKDKASDYFKLKLVLFWLRRSYLLCHPLSEEKFDDLKDTYAKQFNNREATYFAETTFSMDTEIGPMAVKAHLWLAEMYYNNGMHDESEKLAQLEYCQQDVFEVVSADANYVTLKDSKGEGYKLRNVYPDVFRTRWYIRTALVKYGDYDWEINGVLCESRKDVYEKMSEFAKNLRYSYERVYPLYMERTNGKRLAFFENSRQLNDWLKKVSPEQDMSEVARQLPSGSQVAFISKKAGIVFAPGIVHAVKCDDNPYYRKCDARILQSETMNAVINIETVHPELLNYLLENKMLQDGDLSAMHQLDIGNKIFTLNIDFIARNHRRHYYHDHDY